MRKLIESTFVSLGGDIGAPQDWGAPSYQLALFGTVAVKA